MLLATMIFSIAGSRLPARLSRYSLAASLLLSLAWILAEILMSGGDPKP